MPLGLGLTAPIIKLTKVNLQFSLLLLLKPLTKLRITYQQKITPVAVQLIHNSVYDTDASYVDYLIIFNKTSTNYKNSLKKCLITC